MRKYSKDYTKAFEAMNQKTFTKDARIYKPKLVDGKASATFRFLDAPDSDVPFLAKKYHYWNKQEYLCPKTFGLECPICKYNLDYNLRNDKTHIRKLGTPQQSSYFVNVVVIADKNTPENVGKNFIFKYGNPIKDKLQEVMDDGFVPWDEEYGINFKLEVFLKDEQNNYSNSRFVMNDDSDSLENKYIETPLSKHFKDIDAVKAGVIPVLPFIDKNELLSNEELTNILNKRIAEFEHKFEQASVSMPKSNKTMSSESSSKFDDDDDDFPMAK